MISGLTARPVDKPVIVPDNQASVAGFLPSQVQVSKKYGGGFPANVEGLIICTVWSVHNCPSRLFKMQHSIKIILLFSSDIQDRISSDAACISTRTTTRSSAKKPLPTTSGFFALISVRALTLPPGITLLTVKDHCLDILRQQLMCTVDVGLMGQVWWDPSFPKAFPHFNTFHVCREFDSVRKWAEERQALGDQPRDYLQRPKLADVLGGIP